MEPKYRPIRDRLNIRYFLYDAMNPNVLHKPTKAYQKNCVRDDNSSTRRRSRYSDLSRRQPKRYWVFFRQKMQPDPTLKIHYRFGFLSHIYTARPRLFRG